MKFSAAGTTTAQADRENLAGLVERVTFHNEDSGFCVLRVKARGQRDLITVVGHAAANTAGEFVHASGRVGQRSDAKEPRGGHLYHLHPSRYYDQTGATTTKRICARSLLAATELT